jgi:hypothetical protein
MAVKSSVETWIAMGVSWRKIAISLIDLGFWRANGASLCYRLWLLKKSVFLKTAEISGIENVYPRRERRL